MAKQKFHRSTVKKVVERRPEHSTKWHVEYVQYDRAEVYASLCSDIIAKKYKAAKYIHQIRVVQNFDGSYDVTVWYTENYKATYHTEAI